jgi:hypothetical protein
MRKQWFAAAAVAILALGIAAPSQAQGLRRFTESPTDTNGNDRIGYIPFGWAFTGSRPADQPYDVAAATWFETNVGAPKAKPDRVLDKGEYTLERFDVTRGDGDVPLMRVSIVRHPAPPEGAQPPQIAITHNKNLFSSQGFPSVERIGDGVRYTFTVRHPLASFAPGIVSAGVMRDTGRYSIELLPAREVKLPKYITRAPTFSGLDPDSYVTPKPPQLTREERVAGKRIEFRDDRGGRVVQERKK